MNKKIIEILDDILTLVGLIGLICALGIILSGTLSFIIFIITLVVFSIKLMLVSKKLKNIEIIDEKTFEDFENDLMTYSNDIAKRNLVTVKENDTCENEHTEELEDLAKKSPAPIVEEESEKVIEDLTQDKLPVTEDDPNLVKDEYTLTDDELKRCIRKLGKGRKASDKAKELAKLYGYELKEGETFIAPRKK